MNTKFNEYLDGKGRGAGDMVADAVGVSPGMVSKWRHGAARPSLRSAIQIEQATQGAVPVASWLDMKSG